jgi:hypothetical protein
MEKNLNWGKLLIIIVLCCTGLIIILILSAVIFVGENSGYYEHTVLANLLRIYE